MLISAELRWFWSETPPAGLESWFRAGPFPPGGGTPRRDEYLIDASQTELGVKKRGDHAIEVKGLIGRGDLAPEPFAGLIQLWGKWTSNTLAIDRLPHIVTSKRRWVRKFDTTDSDVRELALGPDEQPADPATSPPERGCLLELVDIHAGDGRTPWWSLAFEAFGPLESVQDGLRRTMRHVARREPPSFAGGVQLSYPEWLSRYSAQL